MLYFLIPVSKKTDALVPGLVDSLDACTDVPFKIAVHISGPRRDYRCVDALKHREDVHIVHEMKIHSFSEAACKLNFVTSLYMGKALRALTHPSVRLNDRKWFGKIQRIFEIDHNAGLVTTDPNTRSETSPPSRRSRKARPTGCGFAIYKKPFDEDVFIGGDDVIARMHDKAFALGGFVWNHGGIRYERVSCPENLEDATGHRA